MDSWRETPYPRIEDNPMTQNERYIVMGIGTLLTLGECAYSLPGYEG
jgi:hypothetical protein